MQNERLDSHVFVLECALRSWEIMDSAQTPCHFDPSDPKSQMMICVTAHESHLTGLLVK
jgi:hypothetical protein